MAVNPKLVQQDRLHLKQMLNQPRIENGPI